MCCHYISHFDGTKAIGPVLVCLVFYKPCVFLKCLSNGIDLLFCFIPEIFQCYLGCFQPFCVANRVDFWLFVFYIFFNFTPPPPQERLGPRCRPGNRRSLRRRIISAARGDNWRGRTPGRVETCRQMVRGGGGVVKEGISMKNIGVKVLITTE